MELAVAEARKVVGAPSLNAATFWADGSQESSRKIWDAVFQHPLEDGPKLVTVKSAELLDLTPLREFVGSLKAELPKTSVLLVASGAEAIENAPFLTANNTKTVKCSLPNVSDLLELIQGWTRVSEMSARTIIEWTGGDIEVIYRLCEKLSLIPGEDLIPLSRKMLQVICDEAVGEFAEALLAGNKKEAIAAARSMPDTEFLRVTAFLDSRLGTISEVLAFARTGGSLRSARGIVGVPYLAAKAVLPYTPNYDTKRIKRCRMTLTLLDSLCREFVGEGLWEILVVLW